MEDGGKIRKVKINSVAIIKLLLVLGMLVLSSVLINKVNLSLEGVLYGVGFAMSVGLGLGIAFSVFGSNDDLLPFVISIILILGYIYPIVKFIQLFN